MGRPPEGAFNLAGGCTGAMCYAVGFWGTWCPHPRMGTLACIAHHTHSTTQLGRKVCCVGVFLAWLLQGEPFVFAIFICFHRRSICVCKASFFFWDIYCHYGFIIFPLARVFHFLTFSFTLKLFDHTVTGHRVLALSSHRRGIHCHHSQTSAHGTLPAAVCACSAPGLVEALRGVSEKTISGDMS